MFLLDLRLHDKYKPQPVSLLKLPLMSPAVVHKKYTDY